MQRPLRVIGRSELLPLPIRQRAAEALDFPVEFELIDGIEGLQRVVTRPESFDVYLQWHTVDLIWTARCIQAIDLARLKTGPEIMAAARSQSGVSKVIDTVFDKLFVQPDDTLARTPSDRLSMLPLVHGVDSFGYLAALRDASTASAPSMMPRTGSPIRPTCPAQRGSSIQPQVAASFGASPSRRAAR